MSPPTLRPRTRPPRQEIQKPAPLALVGKAIRPTRRGVRGCGASGHAMQARRTGAQPVGHSRQRPGSAGQRCAILRGIALTALLILTPALPPAHLRWGLAAQRGVSAVRPWLRIAPLPTARPPCAVLCSRSHKARTRHCTRLVLHHLAVITVVAVAVDPRTDHAASQAAGSLYVSLFAHDATPVTQSPSRLDSGQIGRA